MVALILIGIAFGYWLGRYLHGSHPTEVCYEKGCIPKLDSWHFKAILERRVIEMCFVFLPRYFFGDHPGEIYRLSERISGASPWICRTRRDKISGDSVRRQLESRPVSKRESGVDIDQIPKHIAVIMDGNRRYGKSRYGSASRGHWDGSSKLIEFAKWCIAEQIAVLTVFAFSTENWNRGQSEVDSLMEIFLTHCDELLVEALKRGIRIFVLSSDRTLVCMCVGFALSKKAQLTLFLLVQCCCRFLPTSRLGFNAL
jgi:hypothetical protein